MKRRQTTCIAAALVGLLFFATARGLAGFPPHLSVGLKRSCRRVLIGGTRGFALTDQLSGKKIFTRWNAKPLLFTTHLDGFKIHGLGIFSKVKVIAKRKSVLTVDRQGYRGSLIIKDDRMGKITVVNSIDVETYLRAVVKAEMIISAHPEALKTQAVVARTFAIKNRNRYMSQYGYGLSADVSSQVYEGLRAEDPRATAAVRATRGLVLTYNGSLIDSYYHSACGGCTQDCANVWRNSREYLRPVKCPFCRHYNNFYWSAKFSFQKLFGGLLEKGYRIGPVNDVTAKYDKAGRAQLITLHHTTGKLRLNASQLRTVMGPSRIRSTFFRIGSNGNGKGKGAKAGDEAKLKDIIAGYLKAKNPNPTLKLYGSGSGHGVGLCQWGARKQAELGTSFDQILAYYYSNIKLKRMY